MNNSMIGAVAGASSPSKLAPETIRIRNALIEKYADQPIEELNSFLQRALEAEKDELKRLGLLAARVYILRQKVLSLKAFIRDERMDNIPTPNLALTEQILLDETAHSDIDANNETDASGEWHSLQMVEPGEVNGVRFFQGTVINAKAEDAEKLISSGKAIVIDDEGNPVENNANDSGNNEDTLDPETNATDDGIKLDEKSVEDPDTLDANLNETNTDNSNSTDPNAVVITETVAAEATDDGIALDDKSVEDPDVLDANKNEANADNGNAADPNADVSDETVAAEATDNDITLDDKSVEVPNIEDAVKDTSEVSTKKRDANVSEETKS